MCAFPFQFAELRGLPVTCSACMTASVNVRNGSFLKFTVPLAARSFRFAAIVARLPQQHSSNARLIQPQSAIIGNALAAKGIVPVRADQFEVTASDQLAVIALNCRH